MRKARISFRPSGGLAECFFNFVIQFTDRLRKGRGIGIFFPFQSADKPSPPRPSTHISPELVGKGGAILVEELIDQIRGLAIGGFLRAVDCDLQRAAVDVQLYGEFVGVFCHDAYGWGCRLGVQTLSVAMHLSIS